MKFIMALFILVSSIAITSCSKDQDMLDTVSGTWRIESVQLSRGDGSADSTIQMQGDILSIPSCVVDSNRQGGCTGGKFKIDSLELPLTVQYESNRSTGLLNIRLNGGGVLSASPEVKLITGTNTISEISPNSMVLTQANDFGTDYKNYNFKKRIIRLSK